MNIDTLATALQATLGSGWKVSSGFNQITVTTPLYNRITITVAIYGTYIQPDVQWSLTPQRRSINPHVIAEKPGVDIVAEVADGLRALSYRHHALPALAA